MNELKIFENAEFGQVRTTEVNGQPYFVGSDIARALGYNEPHKAIARHCKGGTKHPIGVQTGNRVDGTPATQMVEMLIIPESDIYRLIIKSKLPSAERFEKWVMEEVLPSIRKNGGYIAGQENMSDEELMAKALLVAQNKIAERDLIIQKKNKQIEEMKPKTIFADAVSASHTSILVGDLAKLICQNGVQIGQKRLFQWLRDNGYLIKRKGADWNMPTQRSIEMGLFEVKESVHVNGNGCNVTTRTPKATGKAQVYFVNKFLGGEALK